MQDKAGTPSRRNALWYGKGRVNIYFKHFDFIYAYFSFYLIQDSANGQRYEIILNPYLFILEILFNIHVNVK